MFRLFTFLLVSSAASAAELPASITTVIADHCVACHAEKKAGGLDLTTLKYDAKTLAAWVKVLDRVAADEMPPKNKLDDTQRKNFTETLTVAMQASEAQRYKVDGRAAQRRLNRREYENALRDLLGLPWLQIKDALPEDGVAHLFSKSADALDVSHVQMARYLAAADLALRQAVVPEKQPPSRTVRYYARQQESFTSKMFFSPFNGSPERASFPTRGFAGQPDVRTKKAPLSDPKNRDLEGVGLVSGAYEPVEPKFNEFKAPSSGRYKLRFMTHSAWAGPGGANNGGMNASGKNPQWFIPDLDTISKGRRSEPVVVYSETPPRILRRLGAFDAPVEPGMNELTVDLLKGETIRPDAARLFRSRPGEGRFHNPLAEKDGQPAVVYRWMEVEGPIHEAWPPPGPALLFGGRTGNDDADAKTLLARFAERAYRRPLKESDDLRFLPLVTAKLRNGVPFTEAMIAGYTAVLCSTEFLYRHETPGVLDEYALAARLALFLWESEPDEELRRLAAEGKLKDRAVLKAQTERLLNDPKSDRFVESFLDYWLDLRKSGVNSPDSTLYNDYYLDDLLSDGMLEETQAFFREMLAKNLPARTVIDSDFAMLNERLAKHYGLPPLEGVKIRRVKLPTDTVRGGLLTQASVLSVTANGTTTSPVLRGAWIMERILGQPSPPPPPVPAVEPDLRGAVTIREQLAKHRDQKSCAVCHSRIDPPGFALESFDVMGGYRTQYRATTDKTHREPGFGKNGQAFAFKLAQPVDCGGHLPDGRTFKDVREFKKLLLTEEKPVARNLVRQLVLCGTGAPAGFADRAEIEKILDANPHYGLRDLIHAVVQSEMFRNK